MGSPQYNVRKDVGRLGVPALVDSTSLDIDVGDPLTIATAGYVKKAAAGETFVGVAMSAAASPASDGGVSVTMDVSEETIYEYPPDAGTVTQALAMATMDWGGDKTVNIDASAVDNVICQSVNIEKNTLNVSFIFTRAGVV